jgi:hypothetical protein
MEHSDECNHGRSTEEVNDMICAPCNILDVEMELLQLGGTLLMAVVIQLPLYLYELQRLVMSVNDCLLSHNIMFPLMTGLYNEIHVLFIGGVFLESILEFLTIVCHCMTVLSENYAYNIVRCISLNIEWLLQTEEESIGAEHKRCFRSSNAHCCSFPHVKFSLPPPLVTWLRAHAIWENPNMKRR